MPSTSERMRWASVSFHLTLFLLISTIAKGWDPDNGDWTKSDATDVRVMTWNVHDGLSTENPKTEGSNNWTAMARIVASMRPDVLIIQEAGDNGCFGCVDSTGELITVMDRFIYGGTDPYLGGNVTSYVQLYAPGFEMPYCFPSGISDNYNRNIICSRWPFADLNGDGNSERNDIPPVIPDEYAPGGNGGIRGFQFGEIDLPMTYLGDLVVGNAHLKSGGGTDDKEDRLVASQNVAYVVDYWYNGAGTGMPDPHNSIFDGSSPELAILGANTAIVLGGDWNEDELTNGRRGPAEWLTQAEFSGGTDGTDRDRSDMTYDSAEHYFTHDRKSLVSGSVKFDYLAVQDSIGTIRRSFIFNTVGTPSSGLPDELDGFSLASVASSVASDHLPVIMDIILPLAVTCSSDPECDDGIACTDDACNLGTNLCENTPNDAACDNDTYCDGVEACNPQSGCESGDPVDCDDGIACTTDSCNESAETCDHVPVDSACDNGTFCDGAEYCDVGTGCESGDPPCDVGLICVEGTESCVECEGNNDCEDDGIHCNGTEVCRLDDNRCIHELAVDCNNTLNEDSCDIANGSSSDVNDNGVPDECEVFIPAVSDYGVIIMILILGIAGTQVIAARRLEVLD